MKNMEILLAVVLMSAGFVGLAWMALRSRRSVIQGSCGARDPSSGEGGGCVCYPEGKPDGAPCKDSKDSLETPKT